MADVEIDTNVKDFTNRINFGIIVCTSGTRPTAVDGKAIYETDTDKFLVYDGASWVDMSGAGGLSNIVEDLTPQLGGDLDCNSKKITGVTEITTTTSILFKKV